MSLIRQAIAKVIPVVESSIAKCKPTQLLESLRRTAFEPLAKGPQLIVEEPHVPGRLGLALAMNRVPGGYHPRFTHSLSRNIR